MTTRPTPDERAAFRAFVRRHHPDVGGDPEVFRRGLAARAAGTTVRTADERRRWVPPDDDPRLDAPITAVSGSPRDRLARAGQRVWRHRPLRRGTGRVV